MVKEMLQTKTETTQGDLKKRKKSLQAICNYNCVTCKLHIKHTV